MVSPSSLAQRRGCSHGIQVTRLLVAVSSLCLSPTTPMVTAQLPRNILPLSGDLALLRGLGEA